MQHLHTVEQNLYDHMQLGHLICYVVNATHSRSCGSRTTRMKWTHCCGFIGLLIGMCECACVRVCVWGGRCVGVWVCVGACRCACTNVCINFVQKTVYALHISDYIAKLGN